MPEDDAIIADDPAPPSELADIAQDVARAEAIKPVAAALDALLSTDAGKKAAREKVLADYKTAYGADARGPLKMAYADADAKFIRAATDMKDRLQLWFNAWLAEGKPLAAIVAERDHLAARLNGRTGTREHALADAKASARAWADRYADWLAAPARIKAQISEYVTKIDQLNADINNEVKPAQAIFTFWFDVAPKHLQLRAAPVADANAPGFDILKDFAALADRLKSAPERDDGSLYLIAPNSLDAYLRTLVGTRWKAAAEALAEAESAYQLRPDDTAALKARYDKLKDNGWFERARLALEPAVQ